MLCETVGIPNGELQEFSHYLCLPRTVVRRLSIFPSCSKRPFIMSLIPVWHCRCIDRAVGAGWVV
jgi:hypothetical protein